MKKILFLQSLCVLCCNSVYAYNNDIISKLAHYSVWRQDDIAFFAEKQNLDARSVDCSDKDLSAYTAEQITFDNNTAFPTDVSKWPVNFNPYDVMQKHTNPGLGIRKLHEIGIDGRGISMAIIDQPLSPHNEYNDNLVHYEEFLFTQGQTGSMHGAAVSSIAVGKTVGVAPKAKLYYFAADLTDGLFQDDETNKRTSKYYAAALDRVIEINKTLSDNERIVVVSISASPVWSRDPEIWNASLERAKQAGIFVTTTALEQEYGFYDNGVYRFVSSDPDSFDSYRQTNWQQGRDIPTDVQKMTLCFPMDHRTTASPDWNTGYVHYADGGFSWMKPFEAGMYVLAKQVKPDITPQEFFDIGLTTGVYSDVTKCVLVNPVGLIINLQQAEQ